MEPYKQEIYSNTVLFSTYKPDEISHAIMTGLEEKDINVAMSSKKWKMEYRVR
jgi:hypothetical protein